jgi:hypothetical protein
MRSITSSANASADALSGPVNALINPWSRTGSDARRMFAATRRSFAPGP